MDLRSGKNCRGVPEMALVSAATVQIAHKYNMIADVYGVTTDANCWDMQIGIERMMAAMVPALAGADHLSGIGGAWENAASYELLVIDDEIYAERVQGRERIPDDRRPSRGRRHRQGGTHGELPRTDAHDEAPEGWRDPELEAPRQEDSGEGEEGGRQAAPSRRQGPRQADPQGARADAPGQGRPEGAVPHSQGVGEDASQIDWASAPRAPASVRGLT